MVTELTDLEIHSEAAMIPLDRTEQIGAFHMVNKTTTLKRGDRLQRDDRDFPLTLFIPRQILIGFSNDTPRLRIPTLWPQTTWSLAILGNKPLEASLP
jgi:hypothetical protein